MHTSQIRVYYLEMKSKTFLQQINKTVGKIIVLHPKSRERVFQKSTDRSLIK